jgi:hypothetical protein
MAPAVVVVVLGVGDDDVMQPEMDTGMGVGWSKSEKNNARMVCSAPGPPPLAASRGGYLHSWTSIFILYTS